MLLEELTKKWSGQWVLPTDDDIRDEFKVEYALPKRNWEGRARTIGAKFPVFDDVEDMIKKVKAAKVVNMTTDMWHSTHNLSLNRTIEDVKDMVASYSRPRDVDRIVAGFEKGNDMPLPIFVRGSKGTYVLSGNTRLNVARIMGIPQKVLMVEA